MGQGNRCLCAPEGQTSRKGEGEAVANGRATVVWVDRPHETKSGSRAVNAGYNERGLEGGHTCKACVRRAKPGSTAGEPAAACACGALMRGERHGGTSQWGKGLWG